MIDNDLTDTCCWEWIEKMNDDPLYIYLSYVSTTIICLWIHVNLLQTGKKDIQ
jgi:hypothetical protein